MSSRGRLLDRSIRATLGRRLTRPDLVPRLTVLVQALAPDAAPTARTVAGLLAQASAALDVHDASQVWLALSVIAARLPHAGDVAAARRRGELHGARAVLTAAINRMPVDSAGLEVEVAAGEVLVDIDHLAQTTLMTGIQRVTHETVTRWYRDHPISFVRWTDGYVAIRRTTADETARALGTSPPTPSPDDRRRSRGTVVIPWRSHVVLPEVALDIPRTSRLLAIVLHSRCATAAIGFDLVPLTSSETTASNVPADFLNGLAAIRHMDRVATISEAAHREYDGWRTMITSIGVQGPEVRTISLPVEASEPTPEQLEATRQRYCVPTVPLVLCVGSHEPRKNHLSVLHAAELLWRRGLEFSLLFVGGNAWKSERFSERLTELQAAGRPIESARGVGDDALWALYRLARCTVFPSLNEGFGLPVAESLAIGTPVVTSDFGSMREIGAAGGALLVDPRDDHAIASAIMTLLTDDTTHARLVREAAERPSRRWDAYAEETWDYLVRTNPLPRSS